MITIYGASDDLVEVDGCEGADEFSSDNWSADLQGPDPDGTMHVSCWYDINGCWQVGVGQSDESIQLPVWPITITQQPAMNPDNDGYSVRLSIDAPAGTRLTNIKS